MDGIDGDWEGAQTGWRQAQNGGGGFERVVGIVTTAGADGDRRSR